MHHVNEEESNKTGILREILRLLARTYTTSFIKYVNKSYYPDHYTKKITYEIPCINFSWLSIYGKYRREKSTNVVFNMQSLHIQHSSRGCPHLPLCDLLGSSVGRALGTHQYPVPPKKMFKKKHHAQSCILRSIAILTANNKSKSKCYPSDTCFHS